MMLLSPCHPFYQLYVLVWAFRGAGMDWRRSTGRFITPADLLIVFLNVKSIHAGMMCKCSYFYFERLVKETHLSGEINSLTTPLFWSPVVKRCLLSESHLLCNMHLMHIDPWTLITTQYAADHGGCFPSAHSSISNWRSDRFHTIMLINCSWHVKAQCWYLVRAGAGLFCWTPFSSAAASWNQHNKTRNKMRNSRAQRTKPGRDQWKRHESARSLEK